MPSHLERKYASLAAAAAWVDCNERTLRRMIAEGKITGYRLGRVYRIDLNELESAMRRTHPTVKAG